MHYLYSPDNTNIEIANLTYAKFRQICRDKNVGISQAEFDSGGYDGRYGAHVVTEVEPPTFDEAAQYRREVTPENIDGVWFQRWEVVDYTPEEIERRLSRSLNWQEFDEQLISLEPDSAYLQLSEWSNTSAAFATAKGNISDSTTRQSHKLIYAAFNHLKQVVTATLNLAFSAAQITEINACLETLGVDWRWEDLS